MEIRARIADVSRGLEKGFRLTFETEEDIRGSLEGLQEKELRLTAVVWREKRSLNANAYYYVLLGKIAEKAGTSVTVEHNRTIAEYGQTEGTAMLLMEDIDYLRIPWAHLHPTTETRMVGGALYRKYMVMRGSHDYDTAEMAALISGTVEDAKALGIETLTPEELARMMDAYEKYYRKG